MYAKHFFHQANKNISNKLGIFYFHNNNLAEKI